MFQCLICKSAFSDARNLENINYDTFAKEKYAEINLSRVWAEERFNALQKFLSRGALLEYGSGTGEFLYVAAQAGFDCTGVDLHARFRGENRHPKICLVNSDARDFKPKTLFDAVACIHLLEHFNNPYELLSIVSGSLNAGGYFLVEVPNYASLARAVSGRRWRGFLPYHGLYFSPKGLMTLLTSAGFEVVDLETAGSSIAQIIKLGIPFVLRRLGVMSFSGCELNAGFQKKLTDGLERKHSWGINIRAVARNAPGRG